MKLGDVLMNERNAKAILEYVTNDRTSLGSGGNVHSSKVHISSGVILREQVHLQYLALGKMQVHSVCLAGNC